MCTCDYDDAIKKKNVDYLASKHIAMFLQSTNRMKNNKTIGSDFNFYTLLNVDLEQLLSFFMF